MIIDTAFLLSYEAQQKRCILEGLAERHGITLEPPELPEGEPQLLGPLHQDLIGQIEQYWPRRVEDPTAVEFAQASAAIARTLARSQVTAATLASVNLAELAGLLGHRTIGWRAGLAELQERISTDYERDLPQVVRFLLRVEMRRDYLCEPMQRAAGVSVRHLLEPLSGVPV